MNHTHLETCPSTQIFLKENLCDLRHKTGDENQLVSCLTQTAGIGRSDHLWTHFENALAFSCSFKLSAFITAPSLFLGVALIRYFEKNFKKKLGLKWPNDLYSLEGKKCGGLLCHAHGDTLIVGIGLNWGAVENHSLNSLNAGAIFPDKKLCSEEKKSFPEKIYQSLLEELRCQDDLITEWEKNCLHIGKQVILKNGKEEIAGVFRGITKEGSAIIEDKAYHSGSLVFTDKNTL